MKTTVLAILLTCLSAAFAWSDDNIDEVRTSTEARGGKVLWGKHFDHEEYVIAAAAIAAGQGGGYAIETAKGIATDFGVQLSQEALSRILQGEALTFGNIEVQGGIATFNHWRRTVQHEPRIRWRGPRSYIEWVPVEHQIPLPNTHQLYLRIQNTN